VSEGIALGRRGLVIGTAGHVDHGKTALVRALTGIETDRWREERERGLTIDIGFAPLALAPDLETAIVDVPGHEDFLKNMLAGATGIDLLLLVIAADEGPMPQTREHLAIARLLDVRSGVVALTKRDRVDDEWLELAVETTRELLASTPGCERWPIVPVSSTSGEGLDELVAALREATAGQASRAGEDLFRMPIDRAFSVHGTGTVVTGTVWSGTIRTGDTVRLLPADRTSRVRALEVHGQPREDVAAGRRCALALVGVDAREAERGTVLVADRAWRPVDRIGVRLELLPDSARPVEPGQRVRLYLGTCEVMARAFPAEGRSVLPGHAAWAVLALESPVVGRARDRAIVRFYSPVTTIGGARIAELDPPRRWEARTAAWEAVLEGSADEAFAAAVELAGRGGLAAAGAPLALGLAPTVIETAAAESSAILLSSHWYSRDAWRRTFDRVPEVVSGLHAADRRAPGVSLEAVRSAMSRSASGDLVEACLRRHLEQGSLESVGPRVRLPGEGPRLSEAEEAQLDRLEAALREGGLQPPTVGELESSLRIPRDVLDDLLRLLSDGGRTRTVTPEIHVDAGALDAMIERVREIMVPGRPAAPTLFKDEFGLSRKYLIPLLETLDREGVTRRTPEGRVLAGQRSGVEG